MLWVKAEDETLQEKVWLRLDGANIDVFDLSQVEPDPFSRVVNTREGRIFQVGIYRFKVVGKEAYTRAYAKV